MNCAHAARVFALSVSFLVACWVRPAFACDCNVKRVGDALDVADVVVSGIVTSIRLARVDQFGREAPTVVDIAIQRSWKGKAVQTVTLHTQRNSSSCDGFEFAVGDQYLVFAARNSEALTRRYGLPATSLSYGVTSCGGTTNSRDPVTRKREQELARLLLR
jgi:hypothetical protein